MTMSDVTILCMYCLERPAVWEVTDHDGDDIALCAEDWADMEQESDLEARAL